MLRIPDHTQLDRHTHARARGRTPLKEWLVSEYLHNTQQTQETNIHALSGIRTRDPSKRAVSDFES